MQLKFATRSDFLFERLFLFFVFFLMELPCLIFRSVPCSKQRLCDIFSAAICFLTHRRYCSYSTPVMPTTREFLQFLALTACRLYSRLLVFFTSLLMFFLFCSFLLHRGYIVVVDGSSQPSLFSVTTVVFPLFSDLSRKRSPRDL